jgi:IPT/TIG domain/Putative Ig domain
MVSPENAMGPSGFMTGKICFFSTAHLFSSMLAFTAIICMLGCGTTGSPASGKAATDPDAVHITTASLPVGTTTANYAAALTASGGTPPYFWSTSSGKLPGGLALNSTTGAIAGDPAAAGNFSFTASVEDSQSANASSNFTINVVSNPAPSISSVSPTAGSATGGTAVTILGANFSPGAKISFGGYQASSSQTVTANQINVITAAQPTGTVSVLVQNPNGQTANAANAFSVDPASAQLTITTSSLPSATVQSAYSATFAATGGNPPYSWSIAQGQLPAGLALSSSAGKLAGTPTNSGTFSFTVRVQDSTSASASAAFSMNVLAASSSGSPSSSNTPTTVPPGPVLTSTVQGVPPGAAVQATSADAFVDSVGVDTHWTFPAYTAHFNDLITMLVNSDIRHIRDGGIPGAMNVLVGHGIHETMVIDPTHGIIPNSNYWSAATPQSTYDVAQYLKTVMPPGSVDALEMPNELDIFYSLYKWHPNDTSTLSTNPASADYYGTYGEAVTKDSWQAIKSDPALSSIKIIGPTIGIQSPSPWAPGSLYNYVDWGGFHPYPGRANTWTFPQPYDTITKYYWDSFEPSVNIANDTYGGNPLMFTWYQAPFISGGVAKPMAATETGYETANSQGGISVASEAKYIPRLFAEYFRNGIVRSFTYELYDEGNDSGNSQTNFGLIYNNLTPKPAYTALSNLLALLAEPGAQFTPGTLNYSLSIQSSGSYTRTAYVHDLLLQKSNGDFYLLVWHEVSDTSNTDASGNVLRGAQRDIQPPALVTTITLPAAITSATLYSYSNSWALDPTNLTISSHKITVQASDTVSVIRLSSSGQ